MLKKLKNMFAKPEVVNTGNGLFVTIEELAEQKKYINKKNKNAALLAAGDVKSAFKGRGVELLESRIYAFGDDVRDIDWRITARKQEPYTKVFHEERDREVYVLLDLSPGMVFGSQKELKSVAAAKTAARLGWMALENNDRFGCVLFDGKNLSLFKPAGSRENLMAIYKKISETSKMILTMNENSIGLDKAVQKLKMSIKTGAFVFIISDFYEFDDKLKRAIASLNKSAKAYMVNVMDALEEKAPKYGEYMVEDKSDKLVFNSNKRFDKEYAKYFKQKHDEPEAFAKKMNIGYIKVRTGDEDVDKKYKTWYKPDLELF